MDAALTHAFHEDVAMAGSWACRWPVSTNGR
jgi:hypothetical protein